MITYTCSKCGIQVNLDTPPTCEQDYKVCFCEAPITVEMSATLTMEA